METIEHNLPRRRTQKLRKLALTNYEPDKKEFIVSTHCRERNPKKLSYTASLEFQQSFSNTLVSSIHRASTGFSRFVEGKVTMLFYSSGMEASNLVLSGHLKSNHCHTSLSFSLLWYFEESLSPPFHLHSFK